MRASLLSLSSQCPYSQACKHCYLLGYRRKKALSNVGLQNFLDNFLKSNVKTLVLPCSSIFDYRYNFIKEQVYKSGKSIKNIVWSQLWDELENEEKQRLEQEHTALFYTDFNKLKQDLQKEDSLQRFFLITKEAWSEEKWKTLTVKDKKGIKVFFATNIYSDDSFLNTEQIYEIGLKILEQDNHNVFSTPFGHDLLDIRNPDHLTWNFSEKAKIFNKISNRPKISVIIPTYNRRDYLIKVIKSLAQQTLSYLDFEIIVVDDGGTDLTEKALDDISSHYPNLSLSYLYVKRNIGLKGFYIGNRAGPMRNIGIENSKGEYILFLDSDIILPKDYLEKIIFFHKNYDVVLPKRVYLNKRASESYIDQSTHFSERDTYVTPWQWYLDRFYKSGDWYEQQTPWKYFMTYCLSVKREVLEKTQGFRTNYISYGYEDLDFGYRAIQLSPKLKLIDEEVFHLYHFDDKSSEYTTNIDFRKFQLAMTARMFIFQNMPFRAEYLKNMATLINIRQKFYFFIFSIVWKTRSFLLRQK